MKIVRLHNDYTRITMNSLRLLHDCIQSIHRGSTLFGFFFLFLLICTVVYIRTFKAGMNRDRKLDSATPLIPEIQHLKNRFFFF